MGDTASLSYCGAQPLGNKALLGENHLLLLGPLAYISSVKKNDVTQPSQTQPLPCLPCPHTDQQRRLAMMTVSLFSLCLPGRRADTGTSFVVTALLGNTQPRLKEAGIPQRDLVLWPTGGQSLTTLLGPSSGWRETPYPLHSGCLPCPISQQSLFWPER